VPTAPCLWRRDRLVVGVESLKSGETAKSVNLLAGKTVETYTAGKGRGCGRAAGCALQKRETSQRCSGRWAGWSALVGRSPSRGTRDSSRALAGGRTDITKPHGNTCRWFPMRGRPEPRGHPAVPAPRVTFREGLPADGTPCASVGRKPRRRISGRPTSCGPPRRPHPQGRQSIKHPVRTEPVSVRAAHGWPHHPSAVRAGDQVTDGGHGVKLGSKLPVRGDNFDRDRRGHRR
jgi:hypothetical protein